MISIDIDDKNTAFWLLVQTVWLYDHDSLLILTHLTRLCIHLHPISLLSNQKLLKCFFDFMFFSRLPVCVNYRLICSLRVRYTFSYVQLTTLIPTLSVFENISVFKYLDFSNIRCRKILQREYCTWFLVVMISRH